MPHSWTLSKLSATMLSVRSRLIITSLMLLISSCVVRSIYPWLGDKSLKQESRLVGAWIDSKSKMEVYISNEGGGIYQAMVMEEKNKTTHLILKHYAIGQDAFLVVSPTEKKSVEDFVTIPGYVLLKVVLSENKMSLFSLKMGDVEKRIRSSQIELKAVGNEKDGVIIFSETEDLEMFVNEQMEIGEFFDEDPAYRFARSR